MRSPPRRSLLLFSIGLVTATLLSGGVGVASLDRTPSRHEGMGIARALAEAAPVVIVMLENQEDIKITQATAPYLTSLKARGRYFSKYYGVVHPSFPNYLAIAAGDTFGDTGGTAAAGAFAGSNIWNQLTKRSISWGVYQEFMPSACFSGKSAIVTSPTKDKYFHRSQPGGRVPQRLHVG